MSETIAEAADRVWAAFAEAGFIARVSPAAESEDSLYSEVVGTPAQFDSLLSPSPPPSLEEIRQTMDKVRQHLKGNPEWDAVSLAAVKDAFDMLLVRLPHQHTQTTPPASVTNKEGNGNA